MHEYIYVIFASCVDDFHVHKIPIWKNKNHEPLLANGTLVSDLAVTKVKRLGRMLLITKLVNIKEENL